MCPENTVLGGQDGCHPSGNCFLSYTQMNGAAYDPFATLFSQLLLRIANPHDRGEPFLAPLCGPSGDVDLLMKLTRFSQ